MDADDDSEGDGDHQIETLLREMRQGADRWVLVKWQRFPHEEDTWEPKKNLHPEALEDYEWKKRRAIVSTVLGRTAIV